MPKFHVRESILIEAGPSEVFQVLRNFKTWPSWSPWLLAEPETKLTHAADGSSYSWDGTIAGAGSMTVIREQVDRVIESELEFRRPWKSRSNTSFQLQGTAAGTEVTWKMFGSVPLVMFFMKRKMSALVAADYRRGLAMLKDLIEGGDIGFELEFLGCQPSPERRYLGFRQECPISAIGDSMSKAMSHLAESAQAAGIEPDGAPFSIYEHWNLIEKRVGYVVALPVAEAPESSPADCFVDSIAAAPTYQIRMTGAYRHLTNAWSTGMMHKQSGVFRSNSKVPPFEVYENDPRTTAEADLVTVVHFPSK